MTCLLYDSESFFIWEMFLLLRNQVLEMFDHAYQNYMVCTQWLITFFVNSWVQGNCNATIPVSYATRLRWFVQKYSKNSNIVKYYKFKLNGFYLNIF